MRRAAHILAGGLSVLLLAVVAANHFDTEEPQPDGTTLGLTNGGGSDEDAVRAPPTPQDGFLSSQGQPGYFSDASGGATAVPAAPEFPAAGGTSGGAGGGVGGGPPAAGGPSSGGGGSLTAPSVIDRKVIRSATLEVTVDNVGEAMQQVTTIAQTAGGFISGSTLTVENPLAPTEPEATPAPARQTGSISIRIPSEAYETAVIQLRALGEVRSENSQASEVTEEYTDLQSRLRNLQATEQQYLQLLASAVAIPDILTVTDRLNAVRLETEQVQGRIQLLDNLSDLATITINLALPPLPVTATELTQEVAAEEEPGWARQAWDDAWQASSEVLEAAGTAAITVGVILLWALPPMLLLLLAWRVFYARKPKEV